MTNKKSCPLFQFTSNGPHRRGWLLSFNNADFVHLHCHTDYSKFDGLCKLAKMVLKARMMGFPAIALTDHGTVGGWIKLIAECNRKKTKDGKEIPYPTIKPILGAEMYLARDHRWRGITEARKNGYTGADLQPEGRRGNRHLLLLAQNWKGYQNICRLSEKSWLEGMYGLTPRIDIQQLAEHSEGVICSTACLSSVINSSLLVNNYRGARDALGIFRDIFPNRLFVETMYHGIDAEGLIIPDQLKLADDLGLPAIATNDVHFIERQMAKSHEVLMCMSTSMCLHNPKHLHFPYPEFYLKSAEEMAVMFGHHPQLLHNTVAVAEMVDAKDIESHMGGMRLPVYKIPPEFKTPHDYLEHLAWEGMKTQHWENSAPHVAALKMELADVRIAKENNNYDFATYFLIKWDIIKNAREKKILTGCGRGSGFASVLLRTLGITYGPDPLRFGLLWQRFLGFDDKRFMKDSDFGLDESSLGIAELMDAAQEKEEDEVVDEPVEPDEEWLEK
jgi:DNA polymerase-3 subunit alpha